MLIEIDTTDKYHIDIIPENNNSFTICIGKQNSIELRRDQLIRLANCIKNDIEQVRFITWCIDDVKSQWPDLTDKQCLEVLDYCVAHHDAELGINWDSITENANILFPDRLIHEKINE